MPVPSFLPAEELRDRARRQQVVPGDQGKTGHQYADQAEDAAEVVEPVLYRLQNGDHKSRQLRQKGGQRLQQRGFPHARQHRQKPDEADHAQHGREQAAGDRAAGRRDIGNGAEDGSRAGRDQRKEGIITTAERFVVL